MSDDAQRLPCACLECKRRFATTAGLKQHWRVRHGPVKRQASALAAPGPRPIKRLRADEPIARSLAGFAQKHDLTCTWCRRAVLLDVPVGHPLSPTREHVIPRSLAGRGGTANKLLAHRICNNLRGTIEAEAFRRLMAGKAQTAAQLWPHLFGEEGPLAA